MGMVAAALTAARPRRRPTIRPKARGGTSVARNSLGAEERELYDRIPQAVDHVAHSSFTSEDIEETLFGDHSRVDVPQWTYFAEVADEIPSNVTKRNVLKSKDEALLFLRYNYARFRLGSLIEVQRRRPTKTRAREMVHWFGHVLAARADLVRANMALVLAMAKRTRIPNVEFGELVSEGNMALLRSVEKFDVSRGFKFSTYACRAILKGFNRLATKTQRYRRRFPTEFDPDLERGDHDASRRELRRESSLEALREILARNTARLSEVEQTILTERFAVHANGKGSTLAEVGKKVRLTNERVRQVQNLALRKLRVVLVEQFLAP